MRRYTYAIADLHGRADLLEEALASIEAHAPWPSKVVFLGDYIDRGPSSRQIIERLMGEPPAGWTWICIKGNHEDMVRLVLRGQADLDWWIGNGGRQTLESYGHEPGEELDATIIPIAHRHWLYHLPTLHIDKHRVFVHAGVDPMVPLGQQDELTLLWRLYNDDDERGHGSRHVVHGHHQFAHGPLLMKGRSNLDTYAWLTGRIVVAVFDDDVPGGPVDLIVIVGDPHPARDMTALLECEPEET